ncbi:hypothetical protein ACRRTK_018383 [Alexandromys fortis]
MKTAGDVTSPGEIRTASVQTSQRKDAIHVHPGWNSWHVILHFPASLSVWL